MVAEEDSCTPCMLVAKSRDRVRRPRGAVCDGQNLSAIANHLVELGVFEAPVCLCGSAAELESGDAGCYWKCSNLIEKDASIGPGGTEACDCVRENAFIKSIFPKAAENTKLSTVIRVIANYFRGEGCVWRSKKGGVARSYGRVLHTGDDYDDDDDEDDDDYFYHIFDLLVEWYIDGLEGKMSSAEMSKLRNDAESEESTGINKLGIYRRMFLEHFANGGRRIHAILEFAGTPEVFKKISELP